jgi:hypothetical protein
MVSRSAIATAPSPSTNQSDQQIKSLTASTDKKNLLIDVQLDANNFNLWYYSIKLLLEDEDQVDSTTAIAPGDCPIGIKATARSKRLSSPIALLNCSLA